MYSLFGEFPNFSKFHSFIQQGEEIAKNSPCWKRHPSPIAFCDLFPFQQGVKIGESSPCWTGRLLTLDDRTAAKGHQKKVG